MRALSLLGEPIGGTPSYTICLSSALTALPPCTTMSCSRFSAARKSFSVERDLSREALTPRSSSSTTPFSRSSEAAAAIALLRSLQNTRRISSKTGKQQLHNFRSCTWHFLVNVRSLSHAKRLGRSLGMPTGLLKLPASHPQYAFGPTHALSLG